MPDPTPHQQAAIETLDRNLLVSAGAGSGKTWVLVERFLRMVTGDGEGGGTAPVEGILTITFTDKAAGEMRERIAAALDRRGCVQERRQLEVAYISTIHSFCRRLLQENPFEAALDPEFATLDNTRAALLREECFEDAVEAAFTQEDEELMALLLACQEVREQNDAGDPLAGLRTPVMAALDAMRSLGWEPETLEQWIDEGVEGLLQRTAVLAQPALAKIWADAVALGRETRDLRLVGEAEEIRAQIYHWAGSAGGVSAGESLESLAQRAAELRSLLAATRVPRRKREYDAVAYEELKRIQGELKLLLEEQPVVSLSIERETAAARQSLACLRLVRDVWRRYDAAKEELSALDFNDLQSRARKLLETREGVRRRYQRKFRYLMIDEFQDTDRLQKSIVDLLHTGDNLFVVGDVKQSIYGWRNADYRLFRDMDREFSGRQLLEPEKYRRVSLADNFRSRPEVLRFVNALFTEAWGEGAPEPSPIPFERLEAGGAFTPKEDPSIELLLVPYAKAGERRRMEADLICRRLKELHGSLPLTAERRRGERVRWRDCLILLRSFSEVDIYESALMAQGIPHFVVGGRGYHARREIRDLVCFLRVVNSPLDDLATAAVLRSPFAGVSLDTLAILAGQVKKIHGYPSLFRTIPEALDHPEIPPEDRAALKDFYELVNDLRKKADRLKPGWLLEEALAATHYDARVLAGTHGRRSLANVRKLVQMANAFTAPDVAGLIKHLESVSKVRADEGDAPSFSEAADVVRLMTVHKAKGLEAPVVVVADLGRQAWHPPVGLVEIDAEEHLVGMKVSEGSAWTPSLGAWLIRARKNAREEEEDARLLYVALTRAAEHLVLAGPMPPGAGTWGEWLYGGRLPIPGPPSAPEVVQLPGIEGVEVRVTG